MRSQKLRGLYLVVPVGAPLERVEAALRGGVDVLQLWQPADVSRDEARRWGRTVRGLARRFGVPLLVHEDVALARELGADGVHLDGEIPTPDAVRNELGRGALVGYTCGRVLKKAEWAERVGADYISFCAVFPSPSAPEACELVPLETVREAKRRLKIPVFASGGITPENVAKVLKTGADGVAVVSAVLDAPDPEAAARAFKAQLEPLKLEETRGRDDR